MVSSTSSRSESTIVNIDFLRYVIWECVVSVPDLSAQLGIDLLLY